MNGFLYFGLACVAVSIAAYVRMFKTANPVHGWIAVIGLFVGGVAVNWDVRDRSAEMDGLVRLEVERGRDCMLTNFIMERDGSTIPRAFRCRAER